MGVGWGGSRGQGLDGWETKDLVSSTLYFWTSQVLLVVKNLPANAGDERCALDHWIRRSPGEGIGNPLQYSCLEKPMDRGAWQTTVVYRVSKSWTWLRNLACTHTIFLHLNIRTRKLSQLPYPIVSWIFSIAIDRILGFEQNWIQGLKLNDILSLPLLSFLCLTLFSLLCFPLALVSGWFSVINGKDVHAEWNKVFLPSKNSSKRAKALRGEGGAGVVLSTSKLISIGAPETASNLGSYVLCGFSSVREVTALDLDLLHLLNDENNTFFSGTSEE